MTAVVLTHEVVNLLPLASSRRDDSVAFHVVGCSAVFSGEVAVIDGYAAVVGYKSGLAEGGSGLGFGVRGGAGWQPGEEFGGHWGAVDGDSLGVGVWVGGFGWNRLGWCPPSGVCRGLPFGRPRTESS